MGTFKIKNPYGDEKSATDAANTKKRKGYEYDAAKVDTKNRTVNVHGTKTTDVKAPKAISGGTAGTPWDNKMKSLLASGVSYKGLAEMGHGYEDALKKKFPGAYKPKTETHDINEKWDASDLDLDLSTTPPPPDITVPVDASGMDPDAAATDAINTKLGDLDDKFEGRRSNLMKRKEESTALNAEGFDSEGTPLKTRGIANKDWGLA